MTSTTSSFADKISHIVVGQKVYYYIHPDYRSFDSGDTGYYVAALIQKVNKKTVNIIYRDHVGGGNDTIHNREEIKVKVQLKSIRLKNPEDYNTCVKDYFI